MCQSTASQMIKKIAMIFPYAPSYREGVYRLMDQELHVDWFFCGNASRNLKLLDYSMLKNCNLSMRETKSIGPFTYYKGLRSLQLSNYDVVICAGVIRSISEWWLIQKMWKNHSNTKICLWTHGWYGKESHIQRIIKKIFFRKVDAFLLYGDYARQKMLEEGFDDRKLHVIKNSLDYNQQIKLRNRMVHTGVYKEYFKNDNPTIIFIGRITSLKHLDLLVKAVSLLKNKGEHYNLIFVGDGEMRLALESEVKAHSLDENVWFYGTCFDEKINAELIYNADLCVAPGNIGLTAMHALMFGCPAVSHNDFKWQMPEFEAIKVGKTGAFFERGSVDDLAKAISNWFKCNKDNREKVRKECYKEIDDFWNPSYQLSIIKEVIG